MVDETQLSKDELLAKIDAGWNDLQNYLGRLTYVQRNVPTDAAGWTVKDHVAHLAAWEDGINALLEKKPRAAYMGITPEMWAANDYDQTNEVLRQRDKDLSFGEVQKRFSDIHQRLIEKIRSLSDADLRRPYKDYQTDTYQTGSTADTPVINTIIGNTYEHYAEHIPWIDAIAQKAAITTTADLLSAIDAGWNDIQSYVGALSDDQMTIPTDAAGWTAKDHVAHMAVWEDSINALLEKTPRWEQMDIDRALWESENWDQVNAVVQQRHKDIDRADLQPMWSDIHERLVGQIRALADADLQRPYNEYQPGSPRDWPILYWMVIETYEHYDEHKSYIDRIVQQPIVRNKADLLAAIDAGWNDFQSYLGTLTYEQVTIPTDAARWTVKDHLAHLAVWEDSMNALLEKKSRQEQMGIPAEIWDSRDFDRINAVIQQRYKDLSLGEVGQMFFGIHSRLIEHIKTLSDEDLQRPYSYYQPGSTRETAAIEYLKSDTYEHYAQHKPWIDAIAQKMTVTSKAELLAHIEAGWNTLNRYLDTLNDEQLTQKTDAAGWTVKDHVIHLAIWEDGVYALLERLMRVEYMGIDEATWDHGDNDHINAVIQQRYRNLSWAEVQHRRQGIHARLIKKIESMSDEDLQRPYRFYEMASMDDSPVINSIVGNTFAHYADQLPWIKAIAEG